MNLDRLDAALGVPDHPGRRWAALDERGREIAEREWSRLTGWIRERVGAGDAIADSEYDRKVGEAAARMASNDLARPVVVLEHLVQARRPDGDPHESVGRLEASVGRVGIADRLRWQCRRMQAYAGLPGPPGPPRNLWERRRGLDSSGARWEWVRRRLVELGLTDKPPEWIFDWT